MRELWKQVGLTTGARVYSLASGIVVLAVTSRLLGPSGRGILAAATGWAVLLSTMLHLSLGQVAVYRGAGKREEQWLAPTLRVLLRFLSTAVIVGWAGVVVAFVASGGALFNHLSPVVLTLALLTVPALMWTEYATPVLMVIGELRIANVAQIVASTANALLVVVLLTWTRLGVYAPLLATLVAGLAAGGFTLRIVQRHARATSTSASPTMPAREMLASGAKLHANAVGTYLFTQAGLLVVNRYSTSADTAFYGLAMQLLAVAQIVPTAVGMVAYTVVGRNGPDGAWPQHRRLLLQAVLVAIVIIALGWVLAPVAVRILAGREFLPAVPLFRIMIPSLIGMTFSAVMASQWIGRGFFGLAAALTLTIGLLNFIATLVLVPRLGAHGAAWATLGTYSIAIVGNGIMAAWVQQRVSGGLRPTSSVAS